MNKYEVDYDVYKTIDEMTDEELWYLVEELVDCGSIKAERIA